MRPFAEPRWMLAFDSEDVCTWKDVHLAYAIDDLWNTPGCTPSVQAYWLACDDHHAFRWYLSESRGRMLDHANVSWREFIIGQGEEVPAAARPYLPVRIQRPVRFDESRDLHLAP